MREDTYVWVFSGVKGKFPGAIFSDLLKAEEWILKYKLSGLLTKYPIDQGCFDWAIEKGITNLREDKLAEKKNDADFIGSFSTASQEHYHYLNGEKE